MDAEKQAAAARPTRGSQRLEGRRRGRKRREKGEGVAVGERRRGGQRQDQEGAGERERPPCWRGASRSSPPVERPPVEGCVRLASAPSPGWGGGVASRPPLSLVFPTRGVEGALPGRPSAGGRGPRRGGGGGSEARQEQSDSGYYGD